MSICEKCETALYECPDCDGSGRTGAEGKKCIRCNRSGELCHIHGSDHGN